MVGSPVQPSDNIRSCRVVRSWRASVTRRLDVLKPVCVGESRGDSGSESDRGRYAAGWSRDGAGTRRSVGGHGRRAVRGVVKGLTAAGAEVSAPHRLPRPDGWAAEVRHLRRVLPETPVMVVAGSNAWPTSGTRVIRREVHRTSCTAPRPNPPGGRSAPRPRVCARLGACLLPAPELGRSAVDRFPTGSWTLPGDGSTRD
jgi:hypothetical protein